MAFYRSHETALKLQRLLTCPSERNYFLTIVILVLEPLWFSPQKCCRPSPRQSGDPSTHPPVPGGHRAQEGTMPCPCPH